jgi:tetratricopeptide (TPR) repeat protein
MPEPDEPPSNVISLADALAAKARERLRDRARRDRALADLTPWLDMAIDLVDVDFDAAIACVHPGSDDHAALRCARALRRCVVGDVEAGLAEWADVIARFPHLAAPYLTRARWLARMAPDEALADVEVALALEPTAEDAYLLRGKCHEKLGDADRALANYHRHLAANPRDPDALKVVADALVSRGEAGEAIALYRRAIARAPDRADLHRARARAHGSAGDAQRAFDDASRAIELQPDDAWSHTSRAIYRSNLDHDEALVTADFDRAVELAPGNLFTRFHRAEWRQAGEDYAGAVEDFDRAIAASPRFGKLYVNRAWARAQKDISDATDDERRADLTANVEDLRRAVELGVVSGDVYFLLSSCHRDLGDHAKAVAALDRGLEVAPDDQRLVGLRGRLASRWPVPCLAV